MSKNKEWSDEEQLKFWTAAPIRYGLTLLIALLILINILTMKHFLFDGKAFDWGAASILLSMVVSAVFVGKKVERIKSAIKEK